jgi:hypothetical protein
VSRGVGHSVLGLALSDFYKWVDTSYGGVKIWSVHNSQFCPNIRYWKMRSQSIGLLHTSLKCTKQWQTSQPSTRLYPCLFSTSSVSQSGHNRWSKIRHDKGANDAKRGSAFSKISQEITYASKCEYQRTPTTHKP